MRVTNRQCCREFILYYFYAFYIKRYEERFEFRDNKVGQHSAFIPAIIILSPGVDGPGSIPEHACSLRLATAAILRAALTRASGFVACSQCCGHRELLQCCGLRLVDVVLSFWLTPKGSDLGHLTWSHCLVLVNNFT